MITTGDSERFARGTLTTAADVPVMRPLLPPAAKLLPYLERIDAARFYSNSGPLLQELSTGLARHFGVADSLIALAANGTVALSAALVAVGAKPGRTCLLPSWTFVGTAAAAWAANLKPHFVDVSESTWMLDPAELRRRDDLPEVGAVVVVSPFGAPVDTAVWDAFADETGIPVVIDGAAAFDTVASVPSARPGRAPVMISLHATKVLGVGEGSLVLSTDESLIDAIRKICNFGMGRSPEGQILGFNGKLSEYHAAVGLAALEGWRERRAAIERLTHVYTSRLRDLGGVATVPGFGAGWVSCYGNIRVDGRAARIIDGMSGARIATRRWWRSGVHTQRAYERFPHDPLPVTESLAASVVGLPFFHDITADQLDRVFTSLRAILAEIDAD